MIETAVILAAGLGSRLNERTDLLPKSFLKVGGRRLIEMSLEKLIGAGIMQIFIGTGHCSEAFVEIQAAFPQVVLIHSPLYKTTGSMYTLYNMRSQLHEPFLLLESDLLYDDEALQLLLNHQADNVILGSDLTPYGDEVFLETDDNGILAGVSKVRDALDRVESVLVGISKISSAGYEKLCETFEAVMDKEPKADYEIVMARAKESVSFQVLNEPGLIWCEVDDEQDLNRARTEIYPELQALIRGEI